jgi:CzcA family heavy metal efflux pump
VLSWFDGLVRQRRFVYLAVAILSAAGVATALSLPSSIYPELNFQRITIVAQGTAFGSRQQMFSVTRPIEEAISVVPGVQRVTSRTIRGGSELSMYFAPKTDMVVALQLTEARIDQIKGDLPEGIEIETERMLPSLFPIITYNLIGPDPGQLYDLAQYTIRPALAGIPGVGLVEVQGSEIREYEVIASPDVLATSGLSYDALADALRTGLGVHAVGRENRDYLQYLVLIDREAHSVEDIGNVVLPGGLRVRDVATVQLGTEERVRLIRGDAKPAALINISRQAGGSTLAVADSVAATMASLAPTLPRGVKVEVVYDQAELVRDAVKSVRDAMIIGAVLAVLVLLVFLREGRITAISALAIPLTMAITVFGMKLLHGSFNLMSLGGMAIAIGLVIDDAVVVTENIARHLALTPVRRVAIREAIGELIWPVTTSTLTTVVVFLPLVLLQGVVGQFFAALSTTLAVAVLVSLVLALTLVPLLADQFLQAEKVVEAEAPELGLVDPRTGWRARMSDRIGGTIERVNEAYGRALDRVIPRPWPLVAIAVVLIFAGWLVQRFVGTGFLPVMDEGAFVFDYKTPTGTSLSETDRELGQVEKVMLETPEVEAISRRTGAEMGLFATEQNSGDLVARLKPAGQRSRSIFDVMDDIRGQVEEAAPRMDIEFTQILSDLINDLAGSPEPIEVKLFGEQLDALRGYAEALGKKLEPVPGLVDLQDGVPDPAPELMMKVNEPAAAHLGLTANDVATQVSAALMGESGGSVRSDERTVDIRVRAPDALRFDPIRLGAIPIYGKDSRTPTPLSALATFADSNSAAELLRENQRQMIRITGGVEGRALGQVVSDVQAVLAANPPPAGIRVVLAGQAEGQREAFKSLMLALGLASLSVVGVMLIQFESFLEPLAILLAAPLSFVGAVALLLVTGTVLNVSSLMGLILLVGLIVKNGIILLDFARHRMRYEGEPLGIAVRAAARVRLRPILMTTLCTLFGLLPLALGLGAGSELQRPLALAVIGGLTLSTPITLFLVPTIVVALRGEDWRLPAEVLAADAAPLVDPAM